MRKLILILFVVFPLLSAAQKNDSLEGVWQDNEVVAAGWSNAFLFFKDGTFKFFYNQMDKRKRDFSFSGTWEIEGDGLYLNVKERQHLEGGRLIGNDLGEKSDSILIETSMKTVTVNPPERQELSISKVYSGSEFAMGKYIYIDAIKFYLFSKNPEELLPQFQQ